MNQPRLRFKEFKGNFVITKIKDISNVVGGGTPSTNNPDYWDGDINWYSPNEIGDNPFSYSSNKKITELGLKKSSATLHPVNTILFTSRAGIGKMTIIKTSATTNQGFQSLELKKGIDPYFVYSMNNKLKHKAILLSSGSTFLEISKKSMENIKVSIPSYPEQQKIGQFFQNLDQQIELQSDKLEHLKQSKQGYLQKMFTNDHNKQPKLRFKKFNDRFKKFKLKDVCLSQHSNLSFNGVVKNNSVVNRYPVFDVSKVIGHSETYDQSEKYISIIKDGSGVGESRLRPAYSSVISTMSYILPKDNVNVFFLNYLFKTLNIIKYKVGTGIPHIYFKDYSDLRIFLPSLPEQKLIGQFFSHLDHLIDLQQQKVDHLKQLKQAYLQKMFV